MSHLHQHSKWCTSDSETPQFARHWNIEEDHICVCHKLKQALSIRPSSTVTVIPDTCHAKPSVHIRIPFRG